MGVTGVVNHQQNHWNTVSTVFFACFDDPEPTCWLGCTVSISHCMEHPSVARGVRPRNASVLFLFHFGLFSLHPQPAWYRTFAQMRAATHLPAIEPRPKQPGALPSTDLARWVWPEVALQYLPARPIILFASWHGFIGSGNATWQRWISMKIVIIKGNIKII